VQDQRRAIEFFARYFGFDPSTAYRYPNGVIIVHDADEAPEPRPEAQHG